MKPESLSPPGGSPCEMLFELFSTTHGTASVGRMLKGIDVGRFVLLRATPAELSAQALAAIDVSRSLAHPRFAKLLGVIRTEDGQYMASEYIPGVSLLELTLAVRKRKTTVDPAVAVHIIRDALKCTASAQQSLRSTAKVGYVRCIFPDTVWIAEFGDVLLTEVGVAPHIVHAKEEPLEVAAAKDVMAAAVELFHLVSGQLITAQTTQNLAEYVPLPLASVLERALGVKGNAPFATLEQFSEALSSLPSEFKSSDDEVCAEITRICGPTLELRRRKLELFERGAASQSEDDATQFYRADLPEKRNIATTPPPADAPASSGVRLASDTPEPIAPTHHPEAESAKPAKPAKPESESVKSESVKSPQPSEPLEAPARPLAVSLARARLPRTIWLYALVVFALLMLAAALVSRRRSLGQALPTPPSHALLAYVTNAGSVDGERVVAVRGRRCG